MRRLKYAAIWLLDKVDDHLLRHCFHPRLCDWLAMHPWWDLGPARRRSGGTRTGRDR